MDEFLIKEIFGNKSTLKTECFRVLCESLLHLFDARQYKKFVLSHNISPYPSTYSSLHVICILNINNIVASKDQYLFH